MTGLPVSTSPSQRHALGFVFQFGFRRAPALDVPGSLVWANKIRGSVTDGFALFANSWQTRDGKLLLETGNGTAGDIATTPTGVIGTSQWHHVAAAVNRGEGNARLFANGVERTELGGVRIDFNNQKNVLLGRFADGLYSFRGRLEEARIESAARSSNWIWASWLTIASNATLGSYSAVLRQSPPLAADVSAGNVTLHWPGSGVGFAVYTTSNLTPPVVWTAVTSALVFTNGLWELALTNGGGPMRFYRLQSL